VTTELLARLVRSFRDTLAADAESDAALMARLRAGRDPAAAEAIVRRHGPKVLAACRKVLGPAPESEDAFQATFLVLLRNPMAVRRSASLGAWLYGVAHRTALQARSRRLRRSEPPPADLPAPPTVPWQEACAVLHEEMDRLPDAVRMPLVLCYLDGLSRDEAAHQLGRSLNSVKKSLEKGRAALRTRLAKRGVTLSAGLLAMVTEPVTAGLSVGLVRETVQGPISPAAVLLAKAAGRGFSGAKAVGAFLAASVLAVGVALGLPGEQKSDAPAKDAPAKAEPATDVIKYAGTVTGPDGKPVRGAKLWLYLDGSGTAPLRAVGESGADGKFAFEIKKKDLPAGCYYENGRELWSTGAVLAVATGLPVGWGHASVEPGYHIPVRIPAAVPIEGTIKNLEGQPVVGVTVRVVGLYFPKEETLDRFAEDVKDGKLDQTLIYRHLSAWEGDDLRDGALNPVFPPVKTAKDGTFTLKELSRERIALLRIEGEGIETEDVMVMTRPGKSVLPVVPKGLGMEGVDPESGMPFRFVTLQGRYAVHGSKFSHTVAPGRTVTGVIRDADTGKSVPGAVVHLSSTGNVRAPLKERIWTRADADGKYRFTGLPVRPGCELSVEGPDDQPYLGIEVGVPRAAGVGPVAADVKLKRGVWATVRVFDKTDHATVTGEVEYFARADNPNVKGVRLYRTRARRVSLGEPYRVAVLPGPGILAVRIPWQHRYVSLTSPQATPTAAVPYDFRPQDYLGHVRIDPPADSKGEKVEIGLTRGLDE
jgi:RNA polymerase sigma factor (sigma-70 family)